LTTDILLFTNLQNVGLKRDFPHDLWPTRVEI
jgi:hypothetical protein